MSLEAWRPIPDCDGCYEVSNKGRVRNSKTGKVLTPRPTKAGYSRVHITINSERKEFYIHRLVANEFCEKPNGCDVVNHIDNNVTNNVSENLEWTTPLGNVHHGMKQKRFRINAVPVIGYKNGKRYMFISSRQAEKKTGCDHSEISKCCRGKISETKGYTWKYAEVV